MVVNGFIAHDIKKDQVYSVCFESLDEQTKQVAFEYSQTKRQRHFSKDDMNNADITIGDIIENQIKLDTRLSYFQSNIFTHTQIMENHKSSLIWSSLTKLGAMLLVGGIQINLLVELLAATKSKITDIL